MVYNGLDCSETSHSQDPTRVTCTDTFVDNDPPVGELDPLPDRVYIVANDKATWNHSQAHTWFTGFVNKYDNHFFPDRSNEMEIDINAVTGGLTRLRGNLVVHIFDNNPAEEGTTLLQKVSFHTSCSEPLFTGDQFGSLLLFDCIGENE